MNTLVDLFMFIRKSNNQLVNTLEFIIMFKTNQQSNNGYITIFNNVHIKA